MINLHESMGPGRDRTRDPWICSQTRICCQTRYRLRYAAWWVDDGPPLNAGLAALWLFRSSRPVLLRNPIFLWFFSEGPDIPPSPSGSVHVAWAPKEGFYLYTISTKISRTVPDIVMNFWTVLIQHNLCSVFFNMSSIFWTNIWGLLIITDKINNIM